MGLENFNINLGIAFPTAISVNNMACHYSPLASDEPHLTLNEGDLAKMFFPSFKFQLIILLIFLRVKANLYSFVQ